MDCKPLIPALSLALAAQAPAGLKKAGAIKAVATLTSGDSPKPLVRGRDFDVMGWSGPGNFTSGGLVVFGTGLRVQTWDEVKGLNLRGRVAVIPRDAAAPGTTPAERALAERIKRLEELRPAAVLVLENGPPRPLQHGEGHASFSIPVLSIRKGLIEELRPGTETGRDQAVAAGRPYVRNLSFSPWLSLALELVKEGD